MHANPLPRSPFIPAIGSKLRASFLGLFCVLSLLLTGCIRYEVGVNFDSPNRGAIVQRIQVGEQLTSFNKATVRQWLDNLERRARKVGGRARGNNNQSLTVTIPFGNGAELTEKFNTFFSAELNPRPKKAKGNVAEVELPDIEPQIKLKQSNFLLFLRNQLQLDLDLRALGVALANSSPATASNLSAGDAGLVNPNSLLELEFKLQTPWGARSVGKTKDTIAPRSLQNGKTLLWRLKPGQTNHIDVVFWLPSPLGWGAIAIVLLVLAGRYLRYELLPPLPPVAVASATETAEVGTVSDPATTGTEPVINP